MGWFDDFLESTGLNIFGDAINALGDSLGITQHGRDQYFQREMTYDMMNSQQDFQREMFGLSSNFAREQTANQQNFTREMYLRQLQNYPELLRMQNDAQFNLWRQQFQMQNDYNSPGAQVQRMLSAGINPNSVFGGSGSVAVSQMSPSSLGTPQISPTPFNSQSFGSQGSPIGLPSGYVTNHPGAISQIGSFLKDLASAKKLGVETDQLEQLFDYEIEERAQKIFGQRLVNDSISIQNYVNRNIKDVQVRQASYDLLKTIAETENIESDTSLKFEEMVTKQTDQLLNIAKTRLSSKEYDLLKLKVDNFKEEFNTTMENIRADTARKVSETRLNNALRETENQLRDGRVTAQELANTHQKIANDLLQNDLWVSNRTMDAKISGLIHSWQREGIINRQEAEKLYQLQVSSDWAQRHQFIAYVGATAKAIGEVLGGVGSAVSGASSWKNAQWNNLNYQERNRITREIGSERNRILDDYQKGLESSKRSAILGPDWEMYSDQWIK